MPHIHFVFILIKFLKSLLELHDNDITILRNVGVKLAVEKA